MTLIHQTEYGTSMSTIAGHRRRTEIATAVRFSGGNDSTALRYATTAGLARSSIFNSSSIDLRESNESIFGWLIWLAWASRSIET